MVTFSTALTKNEQLDKIIKNVIIKTKLIRFYPSWSFERSQHHWNVWCQTGLKKFTSSVILGNWRKCGQTCCHFKEYHRSFAKMMYVPIQTYQKLLNLISFLNMYFAILNCWWVRKCFNQQCIFWYMDTCIRRQQTVPTNIFLCVRF